MSNLIYLLELCDEEAVKDVLYLVRIVVTAVKIAVPIVLIIVGAVNLFSAITEQDDKKVKEATKSLGKKAVIAVVIFLVPSIVALLMKLIGGTDYEGCWDIISGSKPYTPSWVRNGRGENLND